MNNAKFFIDLSAQLAQLQSNPNVRTLMRSVAQDAQNETISFDDSKERILEEFKKMDPPTRISIISFLNNVHYCTLDFREYKNRVTYEIPGFVWLFENHTRLTKLLTVSMCLESANLRSFGADPKYDDIPQSLIHIPLVIRFARTEFDHHRKRFKYDVEDVSISRGFGESYLNLYTTDRPPVREGKVVD